jgi:CDP-diglyceride synthetase
MFLPDYMKLAFDNAYIGGKKLVKNSHVLFEQKNSDNPVPLYLKPGFVFTVILFIVVFITILEYKQNKHFKVIDFLVFLVIGIIGMILFFMWFGTNHTAVVKNWNLIWALPTHFLLSFFVFIKKKSAFLKCYFLIAGIATILVLPFWPIIPQQFDYAIIPIILLSGLRSYQMYWFNK